MKTLATEIKIGQEIKYGNQWGKVLEAPVQCDQKQNEVKIKVKTLPSSIRRRNSFYKALDVNRGGIEGDFFFRKTTMVQTR